MTATEVNGHQVVADEPTKSSLTRSGGQPIFYTQTRTLLLDDETVVYGCVHCDYTADSPNGIRPHLKKHTGRARTNAAPIPAENMSLADLMRKVAELDKLTADRDHWRQRAQKAERALATLRRALGGTS